MFRGLTGALVGALIAVFWAGPVGGDIYSRRGEDGTVFFTNQPPSGKYRFQYKVYLKTPPMREARPGVVPVPPRVTDPVRYSLYNGTIEEAARTFSIPEAFIRAVIRVESDYDPRVVSVAGAQGLMQLMPATARRMNVRDSFDPRENIMGGSRYLRYLANLFAGDMVLTIAGYHAGEGAVAKYNGVPPYSSTHEYIRKVLSFYHQYKRRR